MARGARAVRNSEAQGEARTDALQSAGQGAVHPLLLLLLLLLLALHLLLDLLLLLLTAVVVLQLLADERSFAQVGAGTEGNQQLNGMECIASGYGGLEDLVEALSEEKVIFGMMKFSLGDGMFARDKFVYLHFNGADCKGMKKAKDNSKKEETVKAMGGSHTEMTFERKVEVTIDDIVEHCLRVLVIDGGSYNKAQMQEKIETQMVKKETAKIGTATEVGKDPSADFMDVLEQVRAEKGSFNWLLANPEPSSPSFHEAGTGSLPEMRKYLHPELVLYGLVRMAFGANLPAQFILHAPAFGQPRKHLSEPLRVQPGQVCR